MLLEIGDDRRIVRSGLPATGADKAAKKKGEGGSIRGKPPFVQLWPNRP
jgi:hypothetical protein